MTVLQLVARYREAGQLLGPLLVERAGWHCSWCFTPDGISKKLKDAPNSDFPRFGKLCNQTA